MNMTEAIEIACAEMEAVLLAKNKAYGNSAAEPVRVFSKADPLEQINVRMDDKLSRLIKGEAFAGDNDELDLEGYLCLKRAIKLYHKDKDKEAAAMATVVPLPPGVEVGLPAGHVRRPYGNT